MNQPKIQRKKKICFDMLYMLIIIMFIIWSDLMMKINKGYIIYIIFV